MPVTLGKADTTDYALVFEEMSTLNRLFATYKGGPGSTDPVYNPNHFEKVSTGLPDIIVFFGKRSRTYFMAEKHRTFDRDGYGRFSPAKPVEHTVIDWVWL